MEGVGTVDRHLTPFVLNLLLRLPEPALAHESFWKRYRLDAADPPDLKTAKDQGEDSQFQITKVQVLQIHNGTIE